MTPAEAIALAEKWTAGPPDQDLSKMPLFDAMRTLLAHIDQQAKDVDNLTQACRVLFRRNKELLDELSRSSQTSPGVDKGSGRKS